MSRLVSLRCPSCRQPLAGENNSRVFFCLACAAGYDLEEGGLARYDLQAVRPPGPPPDAAVYFPFWAVAGRARVSDRGGGAGGESPRLSLVPALFIKNVSYFGDVGLAYTLKRPPLPAGPPAPLPMLPADRGLRAALAYPIVYFYRELAQARDIAALDVRMEHQRIWLLLVPWARREEGLVDPLVGWRYPGGALV